MNLRCRYRVEVQQESRDLEAIQIRIKQRLRFDCDDWRAMHIVSICSLEKGKQFFFIENVKI